MWYITNGTEFADPRAIFASMPWVILGLDNIIDLRDTNGNELHVLNAKLEYARILRSDLSYTF